MKNIYSATALAIAVFVVLTGCSKGYEARKVSGEVTITLAASSYPLVKGDNTLTLKVADAAGKALTDGQVGVRFYMPPMPGMAPMESTAQATAKGSDYAVSVNAPMEGGWKADVTVARPGKPAATATFNVDAR
jgi:type 1 fimbria pilin